MTTDHDSKPINIDCGGKIPFSVSFRQDGSQILGGGIYPNDFLGWLDQWFVKDGREVPNVEVHEKARVYAVVASKDGKWIINVDGKTVEVKNAATNLQILQVKDHKDQVLTIDVSDDSTRFASGSLDKTVYIYDIQGKKVLGPLQHAYGLLGVKFSPTGEYIATAASDGRAGSLKVWNAKSGDKPVVDIPFQWRNGAYPSTPLAWSNDSKRLFFVSFGKMNCLTLSTSERTEWSVPTSVDSKACSLVTNGKFIVCSAGGSISFWDPVTHTQIGSTIERNAIILSLGLSLDNSNLACGTIYPGQSNSDTLYHSIALYALGAILPPEVLVDPACRLPLLAMTEAAFKPWIERDLTTGEAILSQEIASNAPASHHTLANRALVRARLQRWHEASDDAQKSLAVQPSVIGHVAHAVSLLGQGARTDAFAAFDRALGGDGALERGFLSVIKAILLFTSGEHQDALACLQEAIANADERAKYDYLGVLGAMYRKQGDTEKANQAFQEAQSFFFRQGYYSVTISLMFGTLFEH